MAYTVGPNPVVFDFEASDYLAPNPVVFSFDLTEPSIITVSGLVVSNYDLSARIVSNVSVSSSITSSLSLVSSIDSSITLASDVTSSVSLPIYFYSSSGYIADPGDEIIFNYVVNGTVLLVREAPPVVDATAVSLGASLALDEATVVDSTAIQGGSLVNVTDAVDVVSSTATASGSSVQITEEYSIVATAEVPFSGNISGDIPYFNGSYAKGDVNLISVAGNFPLFNGAYSATHSNNYIVAEFLPFSGSYKLSAANAVSINAQVTLFNATYLTSGNANSSIKGTLPLFTGLYASNKDARLIASLPLFNAVYNLETSNAITGNLPLFISNYLSGNVSNSINSITPLFNARIDALTEPSITNIISGTLLALNGSYQFDISDNSILGNLPFFYSDMKGSQPIILKPLLPIFKSSYKINKAYLGNVEINATTPLFNGDMSDSDNIILVKSSLPKGYYADNFNLSNFNF